MGCAYLMEQKRKRRTDKVPRSTSAVLKCKTLELHCGERSVYSITSTSKITHRQEQISNETGRNCLKCQQHNVQPATQFVPSRFVRWQTTAGRLANRKQRSWSFCGKVGYYSNGDFMCQNTNR